MTYKWVKEGVGHFRLNVGGIYRGEIFVYDGKIRAIIYIAKHFYTDIISDLSNKEMVWTVPVAMKWVEKQIEEMLSELVVNEIELPQRVLVNTSGQFLDLHEDTFYESPKKEE